VAAAAAAIEVRGLTRRFGDHPAVAGLDFDVAPGELFGLVGPDGAGKTTTLRMLAGVLRPTAGDARIGGVSVAADPERIKPDLAYMSQRFGLYADLTVDENLEFYADLFKVPAGERAARIQRLFAFSNLAPFRDRLAGALSGGMKQKLGLSCALVHEPKVLLLDEPTFGVDPISRRETASTPVVGSSRSRSSGRCTSAQESASFCFMPPESAPARRFRNGSICR